MTSTPITPEVAVVPGDVVHLREQDYQHGCGPLRMRIIHVRLDLSLWYDGQWVWLEGIDINTDGRAGRFRHVLARVAALPGRRRDMAATVYLSAAATDQLAAAQRALDEHVTSSATGYCLRCHHVGPCPTNEQAAATFTRYGRLPRRTPGATRPQLINARRIATGPDPAVEPNRRYQP